MQSLTRRTFLTLSAATAAGLTLAACQPIQPPTPPPQPTPPLPPLTEVNLLDADTQAKLEKVIQLTMEYNQVPGVALGIVKDGEAVYAKGFGETKIGTTHATTPQCLFQLMDMTHLFTVTAAMQLVEQGKLDLDAPIVEYLPYFKLADERYKQITMRHLLTESAGLPVTQERFPELDWEGKALQTDDGALERYVRSLDNVALNKDPGKTHVFSNAHFDVAGDVIAKVSGEVYEEYMHRHILEPLSMVSSTFYPTRANAEQMATPHVIKGMDVVVCDLPTWSRERALSVGLFSCVDDLNRWMLANLNRGELNGIRILQDASYDEVWQPRFPIEGWASAQHELGLGWFLGEQGRRLVCTYVNSDLGAHGACYLVPELKAGAVALGNQFTAVERTMFYAADLAAQALDLVALK